MRRIPELDAVRGLAALAIVAYHLWFIRFGWLGTMVDLFFVLSGYLITTIILRQHDRPGFLLTFYARRSLRIWPIYYLGLMAVFAASLAHSGPDSVRGLPYYLAYLQNLPHYWLAENPPFPLGFSHTWTLAVEEQYYLIWPLAVVLLGRRAVKPLGVGLVVLAVLARAFGLPRDLLLTRCDGLALGGLLASLLEVEGEGREGRKLARRIVLGAGLLSVAYLAQRGMLLRVLARTWPAAGEASVGLSLRMLAINVLYFSVIGLLIDQSGARWLAWMRDRRLIALGQMSYGIYLYHLMVFEATDVVAGRLGLGNRWLVDGFKVGATLALAVVSWHYVERPLLALKDHFVYRGWGDRHAVRAEVEGLEIAGSGA